MAEIDWDTLDYDDPCALLATLRPVYYRLTTGGVEEEVEFNNEERVRFNRASVPRLEALIRRLQGECRAKNGERRRFAMAGSF